MPKLSANSYRVHIEAATAGTFNEIAGQISHSIDRGEVSFSTTDKTSTVEISGRALRNYALTLEYKPDLPDANGHGRLETIYASGASARVQVRTGATIVFDCPMRVASLGGSSPQNDVESVSVTFTPTAAPTVDLLA